MKMNQTERACYTYTDEECLTALKNLAERLGRTPRRRDVDTCRECPCTWVYAQRFGSYTNAIKVLGLKPNRITRKEALDLLTVSVS
jgi:hypothetical protein